MTMHHDIDTANTAVQLFQNHVTTLDAAQRKCPALKKFLAQVRQLGACSERAAGLVVPTSLLKAFKGFDSLGYRALFLVLPDSFEFLLQALMDTKPYIINEGLLDLETLSTSACWGVEDRIKVLVDIDSLNAITDANRAKFAAVNACFCVNSIPLVMCAGGSIAFGGLLTTSRWDEEIQLHQDYAASDWQPDAAYSSCDRATARELVVKYGTQPWLGKLWTDGLGMTPRINVPVYPYQEM